MAWQGRRCTSHPGRQCRGTEERRATRPWLRKEGKEIRPREYSPRGVTSTLSLSKIGARGSTKLRWPGGLYRYRSPEPPCRVPEFRRILPTFFNPLWHLDVTSPRGGRCYRLPRVCARQLGFAEGDGFWMTSRIVSSPIRERLSRIGTACRSCRLAGSSRRVVACRRKCDPDPSARARPRNRSTGSHRRPTVLTVFRGNKRPGYHP